MNLEAQARYAARAAELKALGGLAPARASALSRLALKTVVKVGLVFFLNRKRERLVKIASCVRAFSPTLQPVHACVQLTRSTDRSQPCCRIAALLELQFDDCKNEETKKNSVASLRL